MASIYVTTSRKPSVLSRRLQKWFLLLLGAVGENRGKRSLVECVDRAAELGIDTVLVINEDHGNPSKLSFARQGSWLDSIILKSADVPAFVKGSRVPKGLTVVADDDEGRKLASLFCVESDGSNLVMRLSRGAIGFEVNKKPFGPLLKILRITQN